MPKFTVVRNDHEFEPQDNAAYWKHQAQHLEALAHKRLMALMVLRSEIERHGAAVGAIIRNAVD